MLAPAHKKTLKVFRKRAQQRWCALLTSARSRIGHECGIRAMLGTSQWEAFVQHANQRYKSASVDRFERSVLLCSGPLGSKHGCPRGFVVSCFTDEVPGKKVSGLHVDHQVPVVVICASWKAQRPSEAPTWHAGIDPERLCELLFSFSSPSSPNGNLFFRCGYSRFLRVPRVPAFCHHPFRPRQHMVVALVPGLLR